MNQRLQAQEAETNVAIRRARETQLSQSRLLSDVPTQLQSEVLAVVDIRQEAHVVRTEREAASDRARVWESEARTSEADARAIRRLGET